MGRGTMPIALCFGLHPAYEIMANFSGLHMDMWGEMEMVGTIMDMDVEMVPCETIDLTVPAHAEIIVEGEVNLEDLFDEEEIIAPTMYALPKKQKLPELRVTAITMRADRPSTVTTRWCPRPTTRSCRGCATRRCCTTA